MGDNILKQKARFHLIKRTVPFNQPYRGECVLCGMVSTNPEDNLKECDNPKNLSLAETITLAINAV